MSQYHKNPTLNFILSLMAVVVTGGLTIHVDTVSAEQKSLSELARETSALNTRLEEMSKTMQAQSVAIEKNQTILIQQNEQNKMFFEIYKMQHPH